MTIAGTPAPPKELRHLITPEGVDLRLRIGSAGERASAFLLDATFLFLGVVAFIIALVFILGFLASLGAPDLRQGLGSAFVIILLLGLFVARNGYFIMFELTARAATPGKRILGLRVAARDGGRLTAEAVFARNAMRELEIFLPLTFLVASMQTGGEPMNGWLVLLGLLWALGFTFFPLFNRDRLRVGDFIAGTWVVKSRRERLSIDLLDAAPAGPLQFAFTPDQAGAYGIKELHVLEDVLRRRDAKTMAAVADRIRGKILWRRGETESDADFLTAYYGALRARLETRLLFGHRRKDKFDKA